MTNGLRFLILERKVPGYLGTTTIMETSTDSTVRHIIYRFRDKVYLDAWENSEELQATGRSRQILYSIFTEGDWFRDMVCYTRLEGKCSSPSQIESGNSCVHWSIFHKLSRGICSQAFTRTTDIAH
jgi:hypothetical protein